MTRAAPVSGEVLGFLRQPNLPGYRRQPFAGGYDEQERYALMFQVEARSRR